MCPCLLKGPGRVWTRLEELGRLCVLLPYPIGLGSLELGRGAQWPEAPGGVPTSALACWAERGEEPCAPCLLQHGSPVPSPPGPVKPGT